MALWALQYGGTALLRWLDLGASLKSDFQLQPQRGQPINSSASNRVMRIQTLIQALSCVAAHRIRASSQLQRPPSAPSASGANPDLLDVLFYAAGTSRHSGGGPCGCCRG
jgi:hypothetical protein